MTIETEIYGQSVDAVCQKSDSGLMTIACKCDNCKEIMKQKREALKALDLSTSFRIRVSI